MASEKLGMIPAQQIHNPQRQLVFSEAFTRGSQPPQRRTDADTGDPGTKVATRELTASFIDHHHHYFQAQPSPLPQASQFSHQWHANRRGSDGDASEDEDVYDDNDGYDDDDDDNDDDEDDEEEVGHNLGNTVTVAKISDSCRKERCSATISNSQKTEHISALGFRDGNMVQSRNEINNDNNGSGDIRNTSGGEMYYSQYLNGAEVPSSSSGQKDVVVLENGYGFSGSKENSYRSEYGDSLRSIFSDPITGTLMEDAMILPCGHSYGSSGTQQIVRVKACYTCSQPVSEDSIAPNLSLRLAVKAFKKEELQANHITKRKRERYDQHKGTFCDSMPTDHPRGKGVQFPFAVTDRVIIKGNKRTPQRFVGREAVVTTQCLNGWYVVKTLDNAESVKLQYRSLAKVSENSASKPSPIKTTPNWL